MARNRITPTTKVRPLGHGGRCTGRCRKPGCGREFVYFQHKCRQAPLTPGGPSGEWKTGCPVHDNTCDDCKMLAVPA